MARRTAAPEELELNHFIQKDYRVGIGVYMTLRWPNINKI